MGERATHDLGGLPWDEEIDRQAEDVNFFARRVTALVELLRRPKRRVFMTDELRRAIESLPKERYLSLAYYEKWIQAVKLLVVEKGVLTEEEIAAREEEIRRRLAAEDSGA